jgi:hypothetical protein
MLQLFLTLTALLHISPAPAQNAAVPQSGPNLVQNAGFESGLAAWNIPTNAAQVDKTTAHNGQSSLRYDNSDPQNYPLFIQNLPVHPGQTLQFSVWIKGLNIGPYGGGADIYIESSDAQEKYIGGNYSRGYSQTFDWQLAKGQYTVPSNAAKVWIGLRVDKGHTGTAWFDDVQVHVVPPVPFASFLQFPNYRGLLKQGDRTPWKIDIRIDHQQAWGNGDIQIKSTLVDSSGKVLLTTTRKTDNATKETMIVLHPSANLPLGNYLLKQEVTDPEGHVIPLTEHTIHVVDQLPKVFIDPQGFTMVDGKRFFPMGIYLGPTEDEHLQRIADGGFNTILCYAYGNGKDPQAYLERAQKHHLKVIYSIKDMYPGLRPTQNGDLFAVAADHLKLLRNDDTLLAWYINDELGAEWMPQIKKMYDQAVQLDPNHPAYQVMGQTSFKEGRLRRLEKYFDVTDVLGIDHYMTGRAADLTNNSTDTRLTVAATRGAKGVWMVPQIYDIGRYYTTIKPHQPPTRDEMRNESYQSLINGATGLIFYSYFELPYENNTARFENTAANQVLFQQQWADITAMTQEINSVTPAVLQNNKVALSLPADAKVQAGAWEYQNKLLIMLANPYYQEETISMAMPTGWKVAQTEQGEIKSTFANGQITFTLPSMGSGVFILEK